MPRGRPRNPDKPQTPPTSRGRGRGRGASNTTSVETIVINTISLPVSEKDEEEVACSLCEFKGCFRLFRIHNLEVHYNLAMTKEEQLQFAGMVLDAKYYVKKIQEYQAFTKKTTLLCPIRGCDNKYKSALGLAYHLQSCGKTEAEIQATLVECEVCHKKFPSSNISWHRKSHQVYEDSTSSRSPSPPEVEEEIDPNAPRNKRTCALKARRKLEKALAKIKKEKVSEDDSEESENYEEKDKKKGKKVKKTSTGVSALKKSNITPIRRKKNPNPNLDEDGIPVSVVLEEVDADIKYDISAQDAYNCLTQNIPSQGTDAWDPPIRNIQDPLRNIKNINPLKQLPHTSTDKITDYLPPTGRSLKFKTKSKAARNLTETTNFRSLECFQSEIDGSKQNNIIAYCGAPITTISWHPCGKLLCLSTLQDIRENPNILEKCQRKTSIQIYMLKPQESESESGADSEIYAVELELIIAIDSGYIHHLQWANYWPYACDMLIEGSEPNNPTTKSFNRIGHIAYAGEDSTCRIICLINLDFQRPKSARLTNGFEVRIYTKNPEIILQIPESTKQDTGHAVKFDWHEENRFIAVGYANGLVAIFDLETSSKLLLNEINEPNTNTLELYPIWMFKGHVQAVTGINFDPSDSRYLSTGSNDRYLKLWDLHLRQEIDSKKVGIVLDTTWIRGWIHVAVSTDVHISSSSSVNNFVRFYQIGNSKGQPNHHEPFNITTISFFEGLTAEATENGKVSVSYFDQFWRDCDYDRNKKKKNIVHLSEITVDDGHMDKLTVESVEGKSPDYYNPEKNPFLVLNFVRHRPLLMALSEWPTEKSVTELSLYYNYIRANKVSWSPNGNHLAVGYHNGLLTIMPITFEELYK